MIAEIIQVNTAVITSLGLPLNSLTIWMIFHHTQKEMTIYSQILLQTCAANLVEIFFNYIVQMVGLGIVYSVG
jgi:hypothetical protein